MKLGRNCGGIVALLCLLAALLPAAAAANQVYWTEQEGVYRSETTPGSRVERLFGEGGELAGIAVDPGHDKVYWANYSAGTIMVGNLDGTGTPSVVYSGLDKPGALALDPAGGRLFWTTGGYLGEIMAEAIWGGTVGGATPRKLWEEPARGVGGIAYDAVGDKLYWSAKEPFESPVLKGQPVYSMPAAGGTRENVARIVESSYGLAVDASTQNIYSGGGREVWASAFGARGESRALVTDDSAVRAVGIALDPVLARVYWGSILDHSLRSVATAGSAGITIHELLSPAYVATLEEPRPVAQPALSGGKTVGEALSCGTGTWAGDDPGVFAGLAPTEFLYSWFRDGSRILGAASSTLTPTQAGVYSCHVAAINAAGQTVGETEGRAIAARAPSCSDTLASTPEGVARPLVLACDTEPGANYELLDSPLHGSLSGFDPATGAVTYTPAPGFSGDDLFTYRVRDGGGISNTATTSILVRPPAPTCAPVSASGTVERPLAVALSCHGAGTLRYSVLAAPAHGKLTGLDSAAGTLTYVPDPGYSGGDSFSFGAANAGGASAPALASVEIAPAPVAPSSGDAGGAGPAGGGDKKSPPPAAPSNRFTLGRPQAAPSGGAKLAVTVPGPGRLTLRGAGLRAVAKAMPGAGTASLLVRPRPATRRRLRAAGSLRVAAKVTFLPRGGSPASRTVHLVLHAPKRRAR